MSEAPLLAVSDLGKAYPAASDPRARLGALGRALLGLPIPRLPVLEGVNFEVHRGQSLGIIGENGAGKSTLLKLVCGVLHPTTGSVDRRGSVGALLELGAGFDPERTGRENIQQAAGLMGMSGAELAAKQEQIIEFADIGRYLDEPVKHYSSGMSVRLGFALVASRRPDLLITDEVLAVGDESFQKKCVRWIEDYLEQGGTLLLVAHSMYHVQKLCRHALWLRQGRAEAYGDVFEVTQDYLAYHERKSASQIGASIDADYDGGEYRITALTVDGDASGAPVMLSAGDCLDVELEIFSPDGRVPQAAFGLLKGDGTALYGSSVEIDGVKPPRLQGRHLRHRLRIGPLPLLPGAYTLKLHAMDPEGMRLFDTVERGLVVRGASREFGCVHIAHRWLEPDR